MLRDEPSRSYQAAIPMESAGPWIFTARLEPPDLAPLFAHALVPVVEDTPENASTAANHTLMEELAQISSGQLLEGDPHSWSLNLAPRGSRTIEYRARAAWDRWWVMALLLALLTAEWGLRRHWIIAPPTTT